MPIKRIYPDMSMQSTSTTVSASSASASSVSTPVFLRRCPWDAGQEQILITEVRSPDRCMNITEPKYTLIGTYWQEVASAAQVHREFHNIQISSKSGLLPSAFCFLLSAFCFLLSAFCFLLSAFCFGQPATSPRQKTIALSIYMRIY